MISPVVLAVACNKNLVKYKNLESREKVTTVKDPTTGYSIESVTKD